MQNFFSVFLNVYSPKALNKDAFTIFLLTDLFKRTSLFEFLQALGILSEE